MGSWTRENGFFSAGPVAWPAASPSVLEVSGAEEDVEPAAHMREQEASTVDRSAERCSAVEGGDAKEEVGGAGKGSIEALTPSLKFVDYDCSAPHVKCSAAADWAFAGGDLDTGLLFFYWARWAPRGKARLLDPSALRGFFTQSVHSK